MKARNIIVFLILVGALGGGWYLFQAQKQKKELAVHNTLKFQQMTAAAKESCEVGLFVMATAINKYQKIKGHYPETLLDLYPNFIMDKPFISSLNWTYDPKNKSYLIKRKLKGQTTFASMGPELRLKTGSVGSKPQALASNRPTIKKTKRVKADLLKNSKTESEIKKHKKLIQTVEDTSSPGIQKALKDVNKKVAEKNTSSAPSIRVTNELDENEKFLLSFDSNRLYIWKTKNGTIGFSNIQYPEKKQLTIYRNRGWVEYGVNQNATLKK